MLFRKPVVLTLLLSACGPQDGPDASLLRSGATEGVSYETDFRIALTEKESQSGAHHVGVSTALSLKSAPRICSGTKEACLNNEGVSYKTSFVKRDDRSIYLSDAALPLSDNLILTVIAESATGETIAGSYQLNSAVEASPCHKAPDAFICDVEAHIARLTNEFRQRQGRSLLAHDQKISYVSRLWSAEQARTGQISHAWFSNGRWRQEYVREFGEQPRLSAENVAMNSGSGSAETVASRFVNQWINSSGHRANMLSGHKTIGVGVAKRGNSWYGTQNFGN